MSETYNIPVMVQSGWFNKLFNRWKEYKISRLDTNHGDSRNNYYIPKIIWYEITSNRLLLSQHEQIIQWNSKLRICGDEYILRKDDDSLNIINHNLTIYKELYNI